MTKNIDWFGLTAGIFAASLWGGMYVVSKVILDVIPPFSLLTLRLLLGSMAIWPFVGRDGGIRFNKVQWFQVLGVGLVGYGISLGFQFVGTKLSTAANGSLVTSATPAFVLVFASIFLGEKITLQRVTALAVAMIGVIFVIDPRNADLSSQMFLGNLSLIAAALTWALYSVLIRKVTRGLRVLQVSLVVFWGGLLLAIPASMIELQVSSVGTITVWVIFGVIYLGIVSTGLAMYMWNLAFARLEAGLASLTFFAQPVVGVGLGVLLLGEELTSTFMIGGGMIGVGLVLAAIQK